MSRSPLEIMKLMARETRTRAGKVPKRLGTMDIPDSARLFVAGQFVLRTGTGYGFHYVPGQGVVVEAGEQADPAELELWLGGSVYAAVACLNGLYPIHASAIAHNGRVHAFTGPSGAGKSTLVAGLAARGLPLFCDDTLLLDLADPARIVALPGHKRLKLTDTALALTGAQALGPVGADTGKRYAEPGTGSVHEPLSLASLTFLAQGAEAALEPIRGAARFASFDDDHYTQHLFLEARNPSRADLFALRAQLARGLAMARLTRPLTREGFAKSLDLVETAIHEFPMESAP